MHHPARVQRLRFRRFHCLPPPRQVALPRDPENAPDTRPRSVIPTRSRNRRSKALASW